MIVWFVGALEIHFALQFLGDHRSFATAVTIESLGHAVKAAGFLIPGAWGVQEGGFIALCAAFGIASPNAIALSLIKRIPDLALRRAWPGAVAAPGGRKHFRDALARKTGGRGRTCLTAGFFSACSRD